MKNKNFELQEPLYKMTVGEFQSLIENTVKSVVEKQVIKQENPNKKRLCRGLNELAEELGVSYSTVFKMKKDGFLEDAMVTYKHTFLIDADVVLDALRKKQNGRIRINTIAQ